MIICYPLESVTKTIRLPIIALRKLGLAHFELQYWY